MRSQVEAVVALLKDSRSAAWLRMIDAAELSQPAEREPEPEAVVAPYRWLLERVGDGVRLTQAGYLPPVLVREAMTALRWEARWIGTHKREDLTIPILELRQSAQRFGFLRKHRGQLIVTKVGRTLVDDPAGLWWHLAARLPDARSDAERHAGVLYLLAVAAGRAPDDELLAEGMTVLGWADAATRTPMTAIEAFGAARDTWALFDRIGVLPSRSRWDHPSPPPRPQARRLARAALLGPAVTSPAPALKPTPQRGSTRAVQLLVRLRLIEPAIWRRLVVPASLTLRELHGVIQTAMGWEDYHLHLFDVAGVLYGDVEEIADCPLGDEETFTVGAAATAVTEFSYEYDFGDSWTHDIRVEQMIASVGPGTPHIVGGERACPPEDCGGPGGYQYFLEALADPTHEEHDHLLAWVGGAFDPEAFALEEANASLELYDRHTRQRRARTR